MDKKLIPVLIALVVVFAGISAYFVLNRKSEAQTAPPTGQNSPIVTPPQGSATPTPSPEKLGSYITPRDLAKESGQVFKFQYPSGFTVAEGGYKTPGGARFPDLAITKNGGTKTDVIRIPGGMSTGPEITCETLATATDECIEVNGRVIITSSKDQLVLKAFDVIKTTLVVDSYDTYVDSNDPIDANPSDNYGLISGLILSAQVKQPIANARIIVKARPVDLTPDGEFSLRSFDSGAVLVAEVSTDQNGRFVANVPLGIVNNPLKELNRLNMFIVSASATGYGEITNYLVSVTDGKTTRVDFDL